MNADSIVRPGQTKPLIGLSDSQRDREILAGRFPKPFKLSPDPKSRAVGWRMSTIQQWIDQRAAQQEAA